MRAFTTPISLAPLALAVVVMLSTSTAAQADDEGSEHTMQLYGDSTDTLGVSIRFEEKAGWTMAFRPRPGATPLKIALSFLPADHAHYALVVGPKRQWLALITKSRPTISGKATAI